ncbi:MAG: right-handed parallel beta-helix repeat-containing protein [Deltaproteobacteria bacterium]|nr:right-handed parallel beta-helix repeat-containing protein [Deltaproteobacteria bacterium]
MIRFLASTKLTVALCLILAGAGIAGSLLYKGNTAFEKQGPFNIFRSPVFLVPAGMLVFSILVCAGKRLVSLPLSRPRTWTFAGLHLGLVLLAAGMILDGLFGFVGTKYYYVGVPESSYFNWREKREKSFPFKVEVAGMETRYHPLNLQIGVKDATGNKVGLYTVREGVPFAAGKTGIVATPRRFDIETKTLLLDAGLGGQRMSGIQATAEIPARIEGYAITPVAYANPEPAEYVARVRFRSPGGAVAQEEIRINHPVLFSGVYFCLVDVSADKYGNPYAGLQMTREPGEKLFWTGALLFGLSLPGHFLARRYAASARCPEAGEAAGERKAAALPGATAGRLILLLAAGFPSGAHAFGMVIDRDLVWKGEVRVAEPVTVEKGATLRIRPGTVVLLSGEDRDGDGCRDGYLQVFGTILVEGEKERPVRFVRMHPEKAWEEVFLKDAVASIRHAVFEGANWGLHVHGGSVKVEHTTFRRNGGGARLKGTGAAFSRCTFRGNGVGLRFWDGGPAVRESVIEGNGTGLFYREGTGGGKITGNRVANREWNLKVGDWAAGDLDAAGNFWGDGKNDAEAFRVGDFREKKDAGRIVLLPALPSSPQPCGADTQEDR